MPVFKFRNLNTGQATPIPPGEYTVGREDNTHVHVEDSSVSRLHARIFNSDEGLFVEDAGSVNGTAAHGAYITNRMKISYGDVVHIGSVPFRVDPEVVGEVETAPPSTGMRPVNRAYMSRDTEKIPAIGETPRVVETISPERLSAPAVSQTGDSDAEDLNAIVMREPEAPPVTRLPIIRPGVRSEPEAKPATPVVPVPTAQNFTPPKPQSEQKISRHISTSSLATQRPAPSPKESIQPVQATPAETEPVSGSKWIWPLVIFLAGLGVGLLLGLIFAKIFIDMGGKPASLP